MSSEEEAYGRSERATAMITTKHGHGVGYYLTTDPHTHSEKCKVTWFDPEHHAWYGETTAKRYDDLTVDDVHEMLQKVPDHKAYVVAESGFTSATEIDLAKHFIKRPPLHLLGNDFNDPIASKVLTIMHGEIKILERLRAHPHPNIVAYHGCVIRRGYVTGFALERYDIMLHGRFFRRKWSQLDIDRLEEGLNAAVAHIHALGLAHNDIKPDNIALDQEENPVLLDFGSCAPFGEKIVAGGTAGWVDDDFDSSASRAAHDLSAIPKVLAWARGENVKRAAELKGKDGVERMVELEAKGVARIAAARLASANA